MVTKGVKPCGLEGLLSSARGNKTHFEANVALHLGTRQASGAGGIAICAAEINAFVKGRISSNCARLAKNASMMLWDVCRRACAPSPNHMGLVFFSKGCQHTKVNVEKG